MAADARPLNAGSDERKSRQALAHANDLPISKNRNQKHTIFTISIRTIHCARPGNTPIHQLQKIPLDTISPTQRVRMVNVLVATNEKKPG